MSSLPFIKEENNTSFHGKLSTSLILVGGHARQLCSLFRCTVCAVPLSHASINLWWNFIFNYHGATKLSCLGFKMWCELLFFSFFSFSNASILYVCGSKHILTQVIILYFQFFKMSTIKNVFQKLLSQIFLDKNIIILKIHFWI